MGTVSLEHRSLSGGAPNAADLEVTRRNTIHDLMAARFGREDWWASPTLLLDDRHERNADRSRSQVPEEARKRHRRSGSSRC